MHHPALQCPSTLQLKCKGGAFGQTIWQKIVASDQPTKVQLQSLSTPKYTLKYFWYKLIER